MLINTVCSIVHCMCLYVINRVYTFGMDLPPYLYSWYSPAVCLLGAKDRKELRVQTKCVNRRNRRKLVFTKASFRKTSFKTSSTEIVMWLVFMCFMIVVYSSYTCIN